MPTKQSSLILIFLFFCNSVEPYYQYECVYKSTPEVFKDYFYDPAPGGKILYLGTDRHGRYLIEKRPPGQASQVYAFYKDKKGELWQSHIDIASRTETPYGYVKNPETGNYVAQNLKKLQNRQLIPKENILYPPKDMPKLNNDDFTMLDVRLEFTPENLSNSTSEISPEKQPNNSASLQNQIDTDDNNSTDSYDSYEDPITQTPTLSEDNNWSAYLFGGGFVALGILGYYYLITNISQCNRFLARENTWSSWKYEEPYEVLLQIEPQYLVDDLIRDINTTYYQENNPVELFLEDIAEEYDTLCKWIQFRITVERLWIPLGPDFYTMEHRLHLLNLMRKTVHYWRAQQLSHKKE